MPRQNKGEDIGFDFGVAQSGAGLRILGFEEECEDIPGRCPLVRGEEALAFGNDRLDGRGKKCIRRSSPELGQARHPIGDIEKIERIEPANRCEIA